MTTSQAGKTKRISAAQAKAKLSELLARVSLTDERYVIERRGKPVAALVSVEDFQRLDSPVADEPQGIWGLVGLWGDLVSQEEIDEFLKVVYKERERDVEDRPVDLSHLVDS
jgi:prevent-host-death family protein